MSEEYRSYKKKVAAINEYWKERRKAGKISRHESEAAKAALDWTMDGQQFCEITDMGPSLYLLYKVYLQTGETAAESVEDAWWTLQEKGNSRKMQNFSDMLPYEMENLFEVQVSQKKATVQYRGLEKETYCFEDFQKLFGFLQAAMELYGHLDDVVVLADKLKKRYANLDDHAIYEELLGFMKAEDFYMVSESFFNVSGLDENDCGYEEKDIHSQKISIAGQDGKIKSSTKKQKAIPRKSIPKESVVQREPVKKEAQDCNGEEQQKFQEKKEMLELQAGNGDDFAEAAVSTIGKVKGPFIFWNKRFAILGAENSKKLTEHILSYGGEVKPNISKETKYLILGRKQNKMTVKLERAIELSCKPGYNLEAMTEDAFWEFVQRPAKEVLTCPGKKQQIREQWYRHTVADNMLAVAGKYFCAVREDGTVATNIEDYDLRKTINDWSDVRSVVMEPRIRVEDGISWVAALTTDGKVKVAERDPPELLDVADWTEIRSIQNYSYDMISGLRYDGTMVVNAPYSVEKENPQGKKFHHFCNEGLDAVGIDLQGNPMIFYEKNAEKYGMYIGQEPVLEVLLPFIRKPVFLTENGTCNAFQETDIVKISSLDSSEILAYRMDGSVLSTDQRDPVVYFVREHPEEQILCIKDVDWETKMILTTSGKLFQCSYEGDNFSYSHVLGEEFRLFRDFEAVVDKNKLADEGIWTKTERSKELETGMEGSICVTEESFSPEASVAKQEKKEKTPTKEEPDSIAQGSDKTVEEKTPAEEKYELHQKRKKLGVCPYCGGQFKRTMLIFKKCSQCGRAKDY